MMQNIHDQQTMALLLGRLDTLTPDSGALWGKMSVSQMLAHCNKALEQQLGDSDIKSTFITRILGPLVRNKTTNDQPFRPGLPTAPEFVIKDSPDFNKEKARLQMLITRMCQSTPDIFKGRKHGFFGNMTPQQWNNLVYKHLDHHFRQFGV